MRANGLVLPILLLALPLTASPAAAKLDPSVSGTSGSGRQVMTLFNRLDANHDGVLSGAELARLRSNAAALFTALDRNGDGFIEKLEFLSGTSGAGAGQRAAVFAQLDKNHDGRVSREEFAVTPRLLAALDADGDGRVTPGEVRLGLAEPPAPPHRPPSEPAPAEVRTADDVPKHLCWIPLGTVVGAAAIFPFGPECGK